MQNRSNAVMATRIEPRTSLDDFPTPPWAVRAFLHKLRRDYGIGGRASVWEPTAGRGHMVQPLREYFAHVNASDIKDYGVGFDVRDFLGETDHTRAEWLIFNPPFRLAKEFIVRAMAHADYGVAAIVRTQFLESADRFRHLFMVSRPQQIYQYVERVPMLKGRYDPTGTTATSYAWVVWLRQNNDSFDATHTVFDWIPPSRERWERPEDISIGKRAP